MFNIHIINNDPQIKKLRAERAELNARLEQITEEENRIIYLLTTPSEQREHQRREAEKERQRWIDISLGRDPLSLHQKAAAEEAAAIRAAELERAQQNNERLQRQHEERENHIRSVSPR